MLNHPPLIMLKAPVDRRAMRFIRLFALPLRPCRIGNHDETLLWTSNLPVPQYHAGPQGRGGHRFRSLPSGHNERLGW